jgi:Flp pilus assembly protein TadG
MNMKPDPQLKFDKASDNNRQVLYPCVGAPRIRDQRVRAASGERGQAFIELALVLPILLALTIGIIELGRLAYYYIEVSNAARAGAQYGAQILGNAPDTAAITLAAQNDAPELGDGLTVTPAETCGCPGAAPGTAANCFATPGCTYPTVFLTVTTTYNFAPLFNYPGISTLIPATLTGVATMPVQTQ